MSLSKLDPSPTSGSSSKASFDGQNPFSEKQHPLLLPTALDIIFSYLTFAEVKSNRLVCKTWGEVGIPFIGRRNLEPVNFSDVSHEDFLALKEEFKEFEDQNQSKPHPKLKLFQGFRLTWEEVSKMSYCNFMPSFKPSQLVISGRNISTDPSTNLNFFQPLVTTLTHLSLALILDSSVAFSSFTALLNNFALLQPMALKILRLEISVKESPAWVWNKLHFTREEVDAMYRAFEVVFQSQSSTLEELELKFGCDVLKFHEYLNNVIFGGIEFPIFSSLHHLTLALDIKEKTNPEKNYFNYNLPIFAPFDFCDKFPQLVQLELLDSSLYKMKDEIMVLTRGHPLKKLNVFEVKTDSRFDFIAEETRDLLENLYLSFPHIEELRIKDAPLLYLKLGGIEILWVDNLRILECYGTLNDFNFRHLKKLEHLQYALVEVIDMEADGFPMEAYIEMLLEHHRQLTRLNRFHLSFPFEENPPWPEKVNQILEAVPEELRAILIFEGFPDPDFDLYSISSNSTI